jgi:hypothetical protein
MLVIPYIDYPDVLSLNLTSGYKMFPEKSVNFRIICEK